MRMLPVILIVACALGCGGGSSNNNSMSPTPEPGGGVNGMYTGTFTPTSGSFPPFQVAAQMQQGTQPAAPVTGTAMVQNAPCLNGLTLNITGAENSTGALAMAMINGPITDGNAPKIKFTGADVSNDMDASFSGPFEIPGPRGSCPEVTGTGTLTRH
jgi:hypothetical protein